VSLWPVLVGQSTGWENEFQTKLFFWDTTNLVIIWLFLRSC